MKINVPNQFLNTINYYTPLTSQVDALVKDPPTKTTVRFTLSNNHRNTNGKEWRHQQMCHIKNKRKPWEKARQKRQRRTKAITMTSTQLKRGIMDGTIASAVSDTGATSTAGTPNDPFVMSNKASNKVFCLPTGGTAVATKTATL